MKNKEIMGKVIKITEEELHNIIKTKIQEALEHNVDLEYSPAIGNKKRGPGKNTMDQMKKRRNTALDEGLDEKPIYRRLPNGDLDYDGDDGDNGGSGYGLYTVELDEDDFEYGFKNVFGNVPENMDEILENNDVGEIIEIRISVDVEEDPGDYWTAPWGNAEITGWEMESDLSDLSEDLKKVVYYATESAVGKLDAYEVAEKLNESTTRRFDRLISESFIKTLKKFIKK